MMISLFLVWLKLLGALHPFHVSVCDIVINSEARSIQISQRLFLDDFELALNNSFKMNLVIDDQSTSGLRDSLIGLYLKEHLRILVDGKEKAASYLGSDFEEDGIWCYIEIERVKKAKEIQVTSSVLFSEFDDQANIIHFASGSYEKSVKLDEQNPVVTFAVPNQ